MPNSPDIIVRPGFKQHIAANLLNFLLALLLAFLCTLWHVKSPVLFMFALIGLVFLSVKIVMKSLYLLSCTWTIGEFTLTQRRYAKMMTTDYIELYRLISYQESQGLFQQLLGVKSLALIFQDAINQVVLIEGLPADASLMEVLRDRAEASKGHFGVISQA